MFEFFRNYQRYFFLVITVVVISSFIFFGTYSTFGGAEESHDRNVARAIDGSQIKLSEVQKLSRFISTDREDLMEGKRVFPNLCNDGVIRKDLLQSGLAELLVTEYFEPLKENFSTRLDRARRFRPYVHPENSALSAKAVWDFTVPSVNTELTALQQESEVTPAVFSRLAKLYQLQSQLPPEILRRILIRQHQQNPNLSIDQRLSYDDFALFGYHSVADWFGKDFLDLVSQFILNAAIAAEEKGYRVSLEEAKGDLIHQFQQSMEKIAEGKEKLDVNFHDHLHRLGFDERSAAATWQKVLLFRRYFEDVGEAAFVDRLPYRGFAEYAHEAVVIQKYQWPIRLITAQDLAAFNAYTKAVCLKGKGALPTALKSVDEVEKCASDLVETTYRAKVAEVSKPQVALKAAIKQVWQWQSQDQNWAHLKKKFSLPQALTGADRLKVLENLDPKLRLEADLFARNALVDENPLWIEEALAMAPLQEKTWSVSGDKEPTLEAEGMFYRIEDLEKVGEKQILPFSKAKSALLKLVGKVEGEAPKEKNPFFLASKEALAALQKDPMDPKWVQSGEDPLLDQFKLQRKEQAVLRTSQEDWVKEQAFIMDLGLWSPVRMDESGHIAFFYVQEKRSNEGPILDQMILGKETLAMDAKVYVMERLLQTIKTKQSIQLPIQKEDE